MAGHPIEGLMTTIMTNLKDMVNVNAVVGDPVDTPDGNVIIPVSRVTFGFAAGGGEYLSNGGTEGSAGEGVQLPFGGGSGAGVTVNPVAFLVVGHGSVRLLTIDAGGLLDRLIDVAPSLISQLQGAVSGERRGREARAGAGVDRGGE